jgi:hypothetical protein
MKFRSLHKWSDTKNTSGLIFIAQLIDELLFDYSLDTYKPSAMNTSLLVSEAIRTIKAIESGSIKRPNLKHILLELVDNLDRDIIAQSLLSVDLSGVRAILKNPKSPDESISTTVELLSRQVPLKVYKSRAETLIIEELKKDEINFSTLRSLVRSYITTLLNIGFSHQFIQTQSKQFFFYSEEEIHSNDDIKNYFKIFGLKTNEYVLLYRAPSFLTHFSAAAKNFEFSFSESFQEFDNDIVSKDFELGEGETFLRIEDVKARDPYRAKAKSDNYVELLQTLVGLYHHKEEPKPIFDCLVLNKRSGEILKVCNHINPMHKCHDLKPGPASRKLEKFMEAFSMKQSSFTKFNRSAELHALALSSESRENQMINLWIAMESLLPNKPVDQKISDIEHLVSSIIPFLNSEYINKILLRFAKDNWLWDSKFAKKINKNIEADSSLLKIYYFFALDEYAPLRNEFEKATKDFYLLKDRYCYIRHILSDPKNLLDTLDKHTTRIEWQVRRIYRARNLIVHEGTTPTYTEVLIENLHHYLDSVMNRLMNLSSRENTINSIDQGFKLVELNYYSFIKQLSEKNLSFTKDNIKDIVALLP